MTMKSLGMLTACVATLVAVATAQRATSRTGLTPHLIASGLEGGYQVVVADINRDRKPDLIVIAHGEKPDTVKDLMWFENPSWKRHVITEHVDRMINVTAADLDGDGIPELALASGFEETAAQSTGVISLLTHNGDPAGLWSVKEIARVPMAHRVRWANIDGTGRPVLIVAPLIGPQAKTRFDHTNTPQWFFRPVGWKRELITDASEGIVHGVLIVDWLGRGRESVITAGFAGVHINDFNEGQWTRTQLTHGDPSDWPKSGTSDIAVGSLGSSRFIAAMEPWHGNEVVVYRMENDTWTRQVLDTALTNGHALVTADLEGRGRSAIIAGERGGKHSVYVYSARDDRGREWDRDILDDGTMGAADCAAADLNSDKKVDIVCIGEATANLKWYENTRK